jgi:tetratricopeptide (TPR) repeat protein
MQSQVNSNKENESQENNNTNNNSYINYNHEIKRQKRELQVKFEQIIDYLPSQFLEYSKILVDFFEDYKSALVYLKKYINSKEVNGSKVFEMIDSLIKKDQLEEAYELFTEILKKTDKDYKIYSKVSNFYLKKKQIDYAIKVLKPCALSNPHNFSVVSKLAYCYLKSGDYELALKNLMAAEEDFSNDIKYNGFLKHMSYCYNEIGQLESSLGEMMKHHYKLPEENNNLIMAVICTKLGKVAEAENHLNVERKMFPSNESLVENVQDLNAVDLKSLYKI